MKKDLTTKNKAGGKIIELFSDESIYNSLFRNGFSTIIRERGILFALNLFIFGILISGIIVYYFGV